MGDENIRMKTLSFWKPNPIPQGSSLTSSSSLEDFGMLMDVREKLLSIPRMVRLDEPPYNEGCCLYWTTDDGVMVKFKIETGPLAFGKVLTINTGFNVPEKTFFRLYVQVFERFEALVLMDGLFLTPHEFKLKF